MDGEMIIERTRAGGRVRVKNRGQGDTLKSRPLTLRTDRNLKREKGSQIFYL